MRLHALASSRGRSSRHSKRRDVIVETGPLAYLIRRQRCAIAKRHTLSMKLHLRFGWIYTDIVGRDVPRRGFLDNVASFLIWVI